MTTEPRGGRRVGPKLKVEHLTIAERTAQGRDARAEVPRSAHAGFAATFERPDPIELLERQAETRVPELVPIRYGRMLVSPFTFYRGRGPGDGQRSRRPRRLPACGCSCAATRICRTSACSGRPERRLVFDINDFDETSPGPFEWDIKRLAASLEVAGRDRNFTATERDGGRARMRRGTTARRWPSSPAQTNLEVFYASLDIDADPRQVPAAVTKAMIARTEQTHRQGPHPRQHARLQQDDRDGRRRAADQARPAA